MCEEFSLTWASVTPPYLEYVERSEGDNFNQDMNHYQVLIVPRARPVGGIAKARPTKKQQLTSKAPRSNEFSPRAHKLAHPAVRRVASNASFDTASTVSMRSSSSSPTSDDASSVSACEYTN